MSNLFARIRHFDAYSKPLEDFRVKTLTGGAVTLFSGVLMVILFVSELRLYLKTELVEELFVDSSSADERVGIEFDVTFPRIACAFMTVDVMDISGEHQTDLQHSIWKVRVDKDGKEIAQMPEKQELNKNITALEVATKKPVACGSCYGAETPSLKCCNTCDDVKEAYGRKGWVLNDIETVEQCKSDSWVKQLDTYKGEGCRVYGSVMVAKVGGNFHVAPGETLKDRHSHVHDLHSLQPSKFDTSHTIKHLSFGQSFPGKTYPLDGHEAKTDQGGIMFQYFVKVVPTMYAHLQETDTFTHQFSVTKHQKSIRLGVTDGLPGLFVQYEFSPLMVKFSEQQKSFTHFLVSVCAIIGGVFTVASLIDAFIYHSSRVLQHKIDLGKAS